MKIHNLYITASFATLLLSFSACNDFLDKLPDNRMELNTEKKVQKFLVSAYPNRNPALLAELYSDTMSRHKNCGIVTIWPSLQPIQRCKLLPN